jgi:transcriptional regulator with XRE-family HTH domain
MVTLWLMTEIQTIPPALSDTPIPARSIAMNIGATIRAYRLQKGMSQGDIEKRTGLLRCYLSRVENGHTVPSLDTLQKLAYALDLQLAQLFSDEVVVREMSALRLSEEEIRFLTQIQRYASRLSENDRKLLLAMVRKFAQTTMV